MTKHEALEAMKEGNNVTHEYFTDDEYLYITNNGVILTEDGCIFNEQFNKPDYFPTGWLIR